MKTRRRRLLFAILAILGYSPIGALQASNHFASSSRRWSPVHYSSSNSPKMNYRVLKEKTRYLLNETSVGEWNSAAFEDATELMEAWSHGQTRQAAITLDRFIHRVVEERMSRNPHLDGVDVSSLYTKVIQGWANCGEAGGVERAEEILDYMQKLSDEENEDSLFARRPAVAAFNAVISSYAESGRPDAAQQSMRVLQKLYDWNQSGRTDVFPNKETYAAVLLAFAHKGSPDAHELVRRLIVHMEELSTVYPSVKPDYLCHNAYLTALLESSKRGHLPAKQTAMLADEYLRKMLSSSDEDVKPDRRAFNMALQAWSKSGSEKAVYQAEALLSLMELYYDQNGRLEKNCPESSSYNIVIACYARSDRRDKGERAYKMLQKMKLLRDKGINPGASPTTVTYNSVMNAYANSRQLNAPLKVEKLLREMHEIYEETGDQRVAPNSRSFNSCLNAWAKSSHPQSTERIMDWIRRMKSNVESGKSRIRPNTWSYNAYIQALSKSDMANRVEEAERTLQEMEEAYQGGQKKMKPDVLTFTKVIHCIALSGRDDAVERASAIVNRMEDLHANGYGNVRPNWFTYNCVINAVAKSKNPGKAQLAIRILRQMQSVALKAQTESYNNVINACVSSDHKDDNPEVILKIALEVFNEAREGPGANWITYLTMLRVVGSFEHDTNKRWRLTKDIFRQCCNDAQLTSSVMTQIRFAVSPAQFSILQSEATDHQTGKLQFANARVSR